MRAQIPEYWRETEGNHNKNFKDYKFRLRFSHHKISNFDSSETSTIAKIERKIFKQERLDT